MNYTIDTVDLILDWNNGIYHKNLVLILIVNDGFGFGVLDALELVKNAKKWNVSVPAQVTCTIDVIKGYVCFLSLINVSGQLFSWLYYTITECYAIWMTSNFGISRNRNCKYEHS